MTTSFRHSRALLAAALLATLASACNGGSRLAETAATSAAAPESPPTPVRMPALTLPAEVELAPGESAVLPGEAQLTFVRVVSDSRCQSGQQCVWAGEVSIALELESASRLSALELAQSTRRSGELGDFEVELTGFGPCAAKPADECATLRLVGPVR